MTENMQRPTAHTLRFMCRVQGEPLPSITWLKNGEVLKNNGRVKAKGGKLVITQCMPSDSGLYQCFAENKVGMDQDTLRLDVEPARKYQLCMVKCTSLGCTCQLCMGETDRQTDRKRERDRERQRETEKETETERERQRETEKQRDRDTDQNTGHKTDHGTDIDYDTDHESDHNTALTMI